MQNTIDKFKTHTGEIITGDLLIMGLNKIADKYEKHATALRADSVLAPWNDLKKYPLAQSFMQEQALYSEKKARLLREGKFENWTFALWQDINTALTGECIALLPK